MTTSHPRDEQVVIDALGVIEPLSVSLESYSAAVADGSVIKKSILMSDEELARRCPNHPKLHDGTKMHSADAIRDAARENPLEPFSPEVLARIHGVLYDCSGAVRHSLALALFYAGDQSCVEPLQRLIEQETRADLIDTSKMVYRYARAALGRCETRGKYYFPQGMPRVLVISDEIDLVGDLLDVTDKYGAHLYQSHSAIDLIVLGDVVAQIVDRHLCDIDDWAAYCEFLDQLDDPQAMPLILIDGDIPVPKAMGINQPGKSVYYISKYLPQVICRQVDTLLASLQGGR